MAAHVLAAAVWSGGIVTVTLLAATTLRTDRAATVSLLRSFGALAAPAAAVLAVTGIYALGRMTPTAEALRSSGYGHVLLIKIGLAGGAGLLGAVHAARLHPRLLAGRAGRLPALPRRSTLVAEAVLACAVLCMAATLAASPPATATPPRGGTDAGSVEAAGRASDLIVDVTIAPNRPGQNFITATVLDSLRPPPAPIQAVRFRLTDPRGETSIVAARPEGQGIYQAAGTAIDRPGDWRVELLVTRPGMAEARYAAPWNVPAATLAPPTAVRVTDGPLRTMAEGFAVLAGMLGAAAAPALLYARSRRRVAEAAR
jgi:copper transport protein